MKISVLISNYKTWPLVVESLKAITTLDAANIISEVMIVDDCSAENIPVEVSSNPLVRIIHNEKNIGYVASVNKGMALLKEEIVLLLDSDARPLTSFEKIIDHFQQDDKLGLLGFTLLDRNNNITGSWEERPGAGSLIFGQMLESKIRKWFPRKTSEQVVFSCALAIRKRAFEEVDGFDEGFDFLDADIDFSMRIHKTLYWKVKVDESIRMLHEGGGSPQLTAKRVIRFYRNRMRLLRKHKLLGNVFITRLLIYLRTLCEYIGLFVVGNLRYPPEVRKDKLSSRSEILKNIFSW
jgi:hypothetical protein